MRTIELTSEQLDKLIVEDLKEAFKTNLEEPISPYILDGLEEVLSYYMKPSEYEEWYVSRGRYELEYKG